MINSVFLGAVLLQRLLRRASPLAGVVLGFLLALGLLLWGLASCAIGGLMSFLGIKLSPPVFLSMCVLWFLLDTVDLLESCTLAAGPPLVADCAAGAAPQLAPRQLRSGALLPLPLLAACLLWFLLRVALPAGVPLCLQDGGV